MTYSISLPTNLSRHCLNDMEIVLASRNRHKIAEIERVLKESGVNDVTLLSLDDIGFDGDIDLNDIFSAFFGGGSRRASKNGPVKGRDIKARVEVTFEEAAFGVIKEVTINRDEQCTTCKGSGCKPGTSKETCKVCGGSGQVRTGSMFMQSIRTCDHCGGTGEIVSDPCNECKGRGTVRKQRKIKVSIPAGIDNAA